MKWRSTSLFGHLLYLKTLLFSYLSIKCYFNNFHDLTMTVAKHNVLLFFLLPKENRLFENTIFLLLFICKENMIMYFREAMHPAKHLIYVIRYKQERRGPTQFFRFCMFYIRINYGRFIYTWSPRSVSLILIFLDI